MYRASKALSVGQARDYYRREYTRGDYYEHDTLERKGEWYGKGAERLVLRGEVDKAQSHAVHERRPLFGARKPVPRCYRAATTFAPRRGVYKKACWRPRVCGSS